MNNYKNPRCDLSASVNNEMTVKTVCDKILPRRKPLRHPHNKHYLFHVLLCLTLFFVTSELHAASKLFVDFESTLGLDDNITHAAKNIDIEHDGFITISGTGGYRLMNNRFGAITAKAQLEGNKFARFNGLSNLVAAGKLNYMMGFGSSFGAPWMSFEAGYGIVEFESFLRDSNIYRSTLMLGMQVDDATSMRAGVAYKHRDAESAVFDMENASAFINLDIEIVKKHIIYLTYKFQTGDAVSSASSVSVPVIDASKVAPVDDDVFIGKKTYRLDATMHFVTLGYNQIKSLHGSFDFSAQYLQSTADDVDLEYEDLVLRLSYFHRFDL